ncbi:MAG: hypothetical protein RLZZ417_1264 [Bacteroidota bacterium]|jgi:uncharacterized membrane protein YgdD (TMEM256/DUF423 family)
MTSSFKFHIVSGLFFACFAVIIGAFAAHGLKPLLSIKEINNFETGVKYQFYHSFALILVGFLSFHIPSQVSKFKWAGFCFFLGILLFSGSLYLLSTQSIFNISIPLLGPITPLGGVLLILGWALSIIGVLKSR